MVHVIGWIIFLTIFWSFAHKSVRALEHFFEQRVKAQSDDELFRYMLERHWEPWARSKGIHKK